jgi:uncharacterized protein (TIGR03437 family)
MRFPLFLLVSLFAGSPAAAGQALIPAATVEAIHSDGVSVSGAPTLSVLGINLAANSLAWDPASQRIYLSLPSLDGPNGNAVQVLNPATGALGANVFVGSEPDLVSVSANGKFLYVGLDGASFVQRVTLPNLGLDIKIALGSGSFSGPYFASDLQASPVADGAVAVVRGVSGESPSEEGGVVIYESTVALPNAICGFIQSGCTNPAPYLFDSIQWNADASVMFGANNEDTGFDFYTVPVSESSGFGKVTDYGGLAGGFGTRIHFDRVTGYVYDDNGAIIDPVAGTAVGKFNASGLMVPDGSLGMAFVLSAFNGTCTLTAFDIHRFTPIATATLLNVVGNPTHLIRWGSNGLAFTTSDPSTHAGGVYVLSGSFVGPAGQPLIDVGGVDAVGSASGIVQSGEWISIYGGNLANETAVWDGSFQTSLGGTSVTIDGKPAYPSYVSPWQVNVQVPDDSATGAVPVVVTTPGGTATSTVNLAPVAPSLPLLDSQHVAAILLRSNGAYNIVGPTGSSLGYPTIAAKVGDSVSLFALGLGPTNPPEPAGEPFSGAAPATDTVTLLINNVSVPVSFAGLSSAGLYQLNFTIPSGLGSGDKALLVSVGGAQTPSGPVISLQ